MVEWMLMKRWRFWIGLVISAVCLWLALRNLSVAAVLSKLPGIKYWWLVPGVAIYFIAVWARAWRWRYLLRPIKPIPTRSLFPITCIGYAGNNIYPARAGEVLRAVVLKRHEDVAISASLATIIVERVFDGVVMLAFVFINLPALAGLTGTSGFLGSIRTLALVGTGAFFGALIVFLLVAMFPGPALVFVTMLTNRFVSPRYRERCWILPKNSWMV